MTERSPLEDAAGAEAVRVGASAILRALGETLTAHGPDPMSEPIIAAAIVQAIKRMERNLNLKAVRIIVHKMTAEKKP